MAYMPGNIIQRKSCKSTRSKNILATKFGNNRVEVIALILLGIIQQKLTEGGGGGGEIRLHH